MEENNQDKQKIKQQMETLMNYFDKLSKYLKTNGSIGIGNRKLYDKKKIDDILCCVEANIPVVFKKYADTYGNSNINIKTFKLQEQLIEYIRVKPPIGASSYLVNMTGALTTINKLKTAIPSDYIYILSNFPRLQ